MHIAYRFDEQALVQRLQRLPNWARTAFAAACATRLLSGYRRFHEVTGLGNLTELEGSIEYAWHQLEQSSFQESKLDRMINRVLALVPDENDEWASLHPYADDATAAVAYTLRSMKGNVQDAMWAAARAYQTMDHFIAASIGADTTTSDTERAIVSDPRMQAELARQDRDLIRLEQATCASINLVVAALRKSAETEQLNVV